MENRSKNKILREITNLWFALLLAIYDYSMYLRDLWVPSVFVLLGIVSAGAILNTLGLF
jgi:hypothetical protein